MSDKKHTHTHQLQQASRETRHEWYGKTITLASVVGIIILVVAIIYFIGQRGLAAFTTDHVKVTDFLFSADWNSLDGKQYVGAAAMIVTSFLVMILATLLAVPFALALGIFMTEFAKNRLTKYLQIMIELLAGIPSVVYGFLGVTIIVPAIRTVFGGAGFGILAGILVLFVMVLPTITSLTIDALKGVPAQYRQASLALGATWWQTTSKVILRAATPGILTAIIFGMARAFGEALAVQMVIGNAVLMPHNLISPAATLTSQLTSQLGNTVNGTLANNALWSLALFLLLMSLAFNLVVRIIGKRKG